MSKITINPDNEWVKEFKKELKANSGHCPCKLIKNKDTKCMCKDFKEQSIGWCECGLYFKENIDEV